jgi:membrane protein DedA with SNARE-associated domain
MEESSWLQAVLDWVQLHPHATGWMIFLVALGESLLLVGILLPGAALLVGLGTLIGLGVVDFKLAWITASIGAFVGDGISFWIGHHFKERLLKIWPMVKFPKLIEQGQSFFKKWGLLSVFIGRFVGLVRPIIPAIAGTMQMPLKKYIAISTIAAILWSPFYLLPGMLFGNAMGVMSKVAGKLAILVLIFVATVALVYWIIHLAYAYLLPRTHRILSHALIWTQKHPHIGKLTSGLIDPRKPEKGSLALMATFVIAITITALFFSLNSETVSSWSLQVDNFMLAFHTDWTEPVMLFILSVTHDLAIIIPSVLVFLWLIHRKRGVAAGHWAFVALTGYILSLLINYFSHENNQSWFGYHHLTWFVTIIAFWAALISGALPHKMRSWPYTLATLLIAVVSFAQLFFHQMSLGVVLISIFSSILWASVVAIAYRMRARKQFLGWPVSAIYFSFQGIAIIFVLIFFAGQFKEAQPFTNNILSEQQWLNSELEERTDWLNRPKQAFSIHYLGDLDELSHQLTQQNWSTIEPSPWKDVWKALTTDENSDEIAIIPSTNNGKIESMIFTKTDNQNLIVLHLWQQPVSINNLEQSVYAGYISLHKINQKMGLTYWKNFVDEQALHTFIEAIQNSQKLTINHNNDQYFIRQMEPQ